MLAYGTFQNQVRVVLKQWHSINDKIVDNVHLHSLLSCQILENNCILQVKTQKSVEDFVKLSCENVFHAGSGSLAIFKWS